MADFQRLGPFMAHRSGDGTGPPGLWQTLLLWGRSLRTENSLAVYLSDSNPRSPAGIPGGKLPRAHRSRTNPGSLGVSLSALEAGQSVTLESVNGSLELSIPGYADADVEAETVHGRIKNDFGLEAERGRWVGSSLKGTLGRGGARIELENVNGSINIRQAD